MQLIETIRAKDGLLFHLPYHQQRLQRSLDTLGSDALLNLADVLSPPDQGLVRCRVLYDVDDILNVTYHPYTPRTINLLQAVVDDTIDYTLKSAERSHLDKLFSERGEADDILIIRNGLVSDTTIANIAFFDGAQWITPASPLLMGTTRQRLLNEKKLIEQAIHFDEISRFRGAAIFNAMLGFHKIKDGILSPIIKG